jgi:hypothetical protein
LFGPFINNEPLKTLRGLSKSSMIPVVRIEPIDDSAVRKTLLQMLDEGLLGWLGKPDLDLSPHTSG